jgi:hypothetical protein
MPSVELKIPSKKLSARQSHNFLFLPIVDWHETFLDLDKGRGHGHLGSC